MKRGTACITMFIVALLLAVPSSLGFGAWSNITILGFDFLDFFDFISNSVLMPIAAFLTCIFVGYIIKPKEIIDEVESSGEFKRKPLFLVMVKYIAPQSKKINTSWKRAHTVSMRYLFFPGGHWRNLCVV